MNQILHIFRKDTRRFWIEIVLSISAILAFAVLYPAHWNVYQRANLQVDLSLLQLVTILVPASWWLLIGRAIQAETLVGDSQFWITRPYVWHKLLASKMLFLAVWIGLPYVVAQFVIIGEAGFHPLSYISVVLFDLLLLTGVLLLPLAALATITANFARMTLTLLGGVVALVALSFVVAWAMFHGYSAQNPSQDHISLPLELTGAILIIVLQYATRRVWLARAIFAGVVLVMFGLAWLYRSQALIDSAYAQPVVAANPAVRAALDPAHPPTSSLADNGVRLNLPVVYNGVPDDHAAFIENVRFSLTAANGATWTSPWNQHDWTLSGGTQGNDLLQLNMSYAVFDRFQYGPVTLRVTFAVANAQAGTTDTVAYPTAAAQIPVLGICLSNGNQSFLSCRSVAHRMPNLTYVGELGSFTQDCKPNTGRIRGNWTGLLQPSFAELNLSPVNITTLRWGANSNGEYWHRCPNSQLAVTQYHLVDRTRVDLTLPNFTLPPVAVANPSR